MINQAVDYERMNKTQLVDLIKKLQLSIQKAEGNLQKLKIQNKALKTELDEIHAQNARIINKRAESRKGLEAQNIEYLERALSVFEDFLDRPFKSQDYMKFRRYLLKVYPRPAYIQEPRITKEQRKLSPTLLEEELEMKRRTGWSESRLRKFFKDKTGEKASTKKT
jgi:hypothetical protein